MQLYFKNTLYSYKTFATTIAETCLRRNIPLPQRPEAEPASPNCPGPSV